MALYIDYAWVSIVISSGMNPFITGPNARDCMRSIIIVFTSDCTDDQEDITVPAGSSYYNFNVVPSLYACDAAAGMITATLLSGGATVYTTEKLIIGPVSVQVDNAFPKSSEVADDDSNVTMTAVTNVVDTVTLSYQWQQETSDVWSNVGALTASPQKTVTSTSRGTSTYRVVVRHSSGASAESPATYVTWDESEIVVDMLSAMNTAVTGSVDYGTAQTALVNCVERRTGTRPRLVRRGPGRVHRGD